MSAPRGAARVPQAAARPTGPTTCNSVVVMTGRRDHTGRRKVGTVFHPENMIPPGYKDGPHGPLFGIQRAITVLGTGRCTLRRASRTSAAAVSNLGEPAAPTPPSGGLFHLFAGVHRRPYRGPHATELPWPCFGKAGPSGL